MNIKFIKKIISFVTLVAVLFTSVPTSFAQTLSLPQPGSLLGLSAAFQPSVLQGIKVYPDNPFRLDFILDKGDAGNGRNLSLRDESTRLIKYFLAALTVPEKDLWVNLSPYEKDRIIPEAFGLTEMGRDLLAQDYLLKQITASVIYPEGETGKKFWAQVYNKAHEKYGTTDIPLDMFNKVWIVPNKAVVFENPAQGAEAVAYVVESRLKVMLETDYLATSNNLPPSTLPSNLDLDTKAPQGNPVTPNDISKQVLREIVIPVLEQEVNEGKNFAPLRQVYQSLILAAWYKKKVRESILSKVYVDQKKVQGINIGDPQEAEKIWGQYVESFKKGAYKYIKEEKDFYSNEVIPRQYFAGGFDFALSDTLTTTVDPARIDQNPRPLLLLPVRIVPQESLSGGSVDGLHAFKMHVLPIEIRDGDPEQMEINKMMASLSQELFQKASPGALLKLIREMSGRDGLQWNDLAPDVLISYAGKGTHKVVYKIKFLLKNGENIQIALAVKKERSVQDISSHEVNNLKRLNGRGAPLWGGAFVANDGRMVYIEEFVEGFTVREYQQKGMLNLQLKQEIVGVLLMMASALGGMVPRDIHGDNFIVSKASTKMVMVDIGNKRLSISGKNATTREQFVFLAILMSQYGARGSLEDDHWIFNALYAHPLFQGGQGEETLRRVSEYLSLLTTAEIRKVLLERAPTLFLPVKQSKDFGTDPLEGFILFFQKSLHIYLMSHRGDHVLEESPILHKLELKASSVPTVEKVAVKASDLSFEIGKEFFFYGELLQRDGEGILLMGDSGSGKSALAIELLRKDPRWEIVSAGSSYGRIELRNGFPVLIGFRRGENNVIYSRSRGTLKVELSSNASVRIRRIIPLDEGVGEGGLLGAEKDRDILGIQVLDPKTLNVSLDGVGSSDNLFDASMASANVRALFSQMKSALTRDKIEAASGFYQIRFSGVLEPEEERGADIYRFDAYLDGRKDSVGWIKFTLAQHEEGLFRLDILEAFFPSGIHPEILKRMASVLPEKGVVIGNIKIQNWPTLVELARGALKELEKLKTDDGRWGYFPSATMNRMRAIIGEYDEAKVRNERTKGEPIFEVTDFLKVYMGVQKVSSDLEQLGKYYGHTLLGHRMEEDFKFTEHIVRLSHPQRDIVAINFRSDASMSISGQDQAVGFSDMKEAMSFSESLKGEHKGELIIRDRDNRGIQQILKEEVFTLLPLARQGGSLDVWVDGDYVLKIPKPDETAEQDWDQLVTAYHIYQKYIWDLVPKTYLVGPVHANLNGQITEVHRGILQERVVTLRDKLKGLSAQNINGDFDGQMKAIVEQWWALQEKMWRRGVLDPDIKILDNYGFNEATGQVVLFDLSHISTNKNDFWRDEYDASILDAYRVLNLSELKSVAGKVAAETYLLSPIESSVGWHVLSSDHVVVAAWPEDGPIAPVIKDGAVLTAQEISGQTVTPTVDQAMEQVVDPRVRALKSISDAVRGGIKDKDGTAYRLTRPEFLPKEKHKAGDVYSVSVMRPGQENPVGRVYFTLPRGAGEIFRVDFPFIHLDQTIRNKGISSKLLKLIVGALPDKTVIGHSQIQNWPTLRYLASKVIEQTDDPAKSEILLKYLGRGRDGLSGLEKIKKIEALLNQYGPDTEYQYDLVMEVTEFLTAYIKVQEKESGLPPLGSFYGETVLGRTIPERPWHMVRPPVAEDDAPLLSVLNFTERPDFSMETTGGIDLTAERMDLQTVGDSEREIRFNIDPAQLQEWQNSPGFVPVIMNIQPLESLPKFLGVKV